ncbi:hypothetical protein [Streptomyces triticisoli]|nr:hypothetical protein [Streptomyces triticisoli]
MFARAHAALRLSPAPWVGVSVVVGRPAAAFQQALDQLRRPPRTERGPR